MAYSVRQIKEEDLEIIMNWRMSEGVTRYMNTNPRLTLEGQKKWFEKISRDKTVRNWIIEVDGVPAGLINIVDIDTKTGTASWGYYVGEEKLRSLKLAISLEMSLYDYCFDVLGLKRVLCQTFKLNEGVWKLHLACGCTLDMEEEGGVEKEGVSYDIIHVSMSSDTWNSIRDKKKYDHINFDIFGDKIYGIKLHHTGVAVADISAAVKEYEGLGWIQDSEPVFDEVRNISIVFMKSEDGNQMIELVHPESDKSPVSGILKSGKNLTEPYHFCYSVNNIDKVIKILRKRHYVLVDDAKEAAALENRKVAFLLKREGGLIEIMEENCES